MTTLLDIAETVVLNGKEITFRGPLQKTSYQDLRSQAYIRTSDRVSYSGDCGECNCDCSQGGDCDCTSAECDN